MDKKETKFASNATIVRLSELKPNTPERTEKIKKAVDRVITQYGEAIKRLADE